MARKKKEEEIEEGLPGWMATYGDLVTLLLTFFILLFSMAVIDKQKFTEIAVSLKSTFLKLENTDNFEVNNGKQIISVNPNAPQIVKRNYKDQETFEKKGDLEEENQKNEEYKKFKDDVEKVLEEMGLMEHVKVLENKEDIILRVDSVILFDSGKAFLKDYGKNAMKELSKYIKTFKTDILIQGHTDNIPINTVLFPSNWELSTKRATNVTLFFIDECGLNPKQLTATGNGEFRPIVPNTTPENRAKNRRIDIVIEK